MASRKTSERHRRRYPWHRRRRWILLAVVLLIASVVAGVLVLQLRSRRAFEARLAEIRATGVPVTLEEMAEAYRPPPDSDSKRNAAEIWRQTSESEAAKRKLSPEYVDVGKALNEWKGGTSLPNELRELLAAHLAENAEALRRLHAAAEAGFAPHALDLSQGIDVDLSHLNRTREAARLLHAEALYTADAGDEAQALRSLRAALAAGESLREEPLLISQLVRISCHGVTQEGWRKALALGNFSEEQLVQMQDAFSAAEDKAGLANSMAYARSTGLAHYDDPDMVIENLGVLNADNYVPGATRMLIAAGNVVGYNDEDRLDYLAHMDELIALSDKPYPEMLPAMESLGDTYEAGSSWLPRISEGLTPALSRMGATFARDAASLRMSAAAAAVERYRLVHGSPPDALGDLTPSFLPALPEDPFDGQALRYRRNGEGYVVYSVFEDKEDDGGTATRRAMEGDWLFEVVR